MPATPLLDAGLTTRRIHIQAKDVVYVKGILDGYGGLGVVFAERGGELTLAAPHSRAVELDAFIADLASEIPSLRRL
jgi:hypothetical protein